MLRANRMNMWLRGSCSATMLALGMAAAAQCPGVRPKFSWASNDSSIVFVDQTEALPSERLWEFGDGDTAWGQVETHGYAFAGDDTVRLTVIVGGCPFSVSGRVIHPGVNDNCDSQITSAFIPQQSGNNHINFIDASQGDGSLLLYLWTFGDDSLSTDTSTNHFYALPGAYDVSHSIGTVDSQTACVAGSAQRVFVDGNTSTCDSSLFLDLNLGDGTSLVPFEAQVAVLDGGLVITSIVWDYGDGTSYIGPSATHAYAYPGEYQVCVRVNAFDSVAQQECYAQACGTVAQPAVGTNEVPAQNAIRAWPVPFSEELWIGGEAVRTGARWRLLDLLGREARAGTLSHNGTEHLEFRTLPTGVYTLIIPTDRSVRSLRLLKE